MLHDWVMRILTVLFASVLATGCYATAGTGYGGTVTATTVGPDLVYVSPGVQVIADYDEPIFYSNGYYWWNTEGTWWQSSRYTGGWREARPPVAIVRIGEPHRYRHYRPRGYTARYRPTPSNRIERPYRPRVDRRARR